MTTTALRPSAIVITRSQQGNEELAERLRKIGLEPITVETISFAPPDDWKEVDQLLRRMAEFDWVVFTSSTGVRYFGDRMNFLSLPLPWKGNPSVAAVGPQTARALSGLGVRTDFVPSGYTTSILGEALPAEAGSRVLLLRADIADRELSRRLVGRGFRVEEAAIYRTLPAKGPNPDITNAGMIVFASPSAVSGFCARMTQQKLRAAKELKAVCIGPVTEAAARKNGFLNTTRPESYTLDAVVKEIARLSRANA